eukprot:7485383-Prorocentrum_lima.AAC.1
MEALGKHCYCPHDAATSQGDRFGMSDEGFVLPQDLERRQVGKHHSLQSRIHAIYPKKLQPRKFRTIPEAVAWVQEYFQSIKARLIRLYGGLTPRAALRKYQRLATEHREYFGELLADTTTFHADRPIEDITGGRTASHCVGKEADFMKALDGGSFNPRLKSTL